MSTGELNLLEHPPYGEEFDAIPLVDMLRLFGPDTNRSILKRSTEVFREGGGYCHHGAMSGE